MDIAAFQINKVGANENEIITTHNLLPHSERIYSVTIECPAHLARRTHDCLACAHLFWYAFFDGSTEYCENCFCLKEHTDV